MGGRALPAHIHDDVLGIQQGLESRIDGELERLRVKLDEQAAGTILRGFCAHRLSGCRYTAMIARTASVRQNYTGWS